MSTATTQRQYDELIADNYDQDPQSVTSDTLDRALLQLSSEGCLESVLPAMSVFDVGMGTGLFYDKLASNTDRRLRPFGLDISARMLEVAHGRVPELQSAVDDAANLDRHFEAEEFDLVSTHFITGFVPLADLAPKIFDKLQPGGLWSFVGATSAAYPMLQKKASSRIIQMLMGNKRLEFSDLLTPADQQEVESIVLENGFEVCDLETWQPELEFNNFDEFLDFSYHGGWLTPFIEKLGLQNARPALRALLNALAFPLKDHHTIVIGLMRKPLL